MRILLLTRYSRLGASSRLRHLQYLPCLQAEGFQFDVCPLLDDAYLERMYAGQKSWRAVLRAYAQRVVHLIQGQAYDVIWVEKEYFPMLPVWVARAIAPRRAKWLVDYDDAVFHNYDLHSSWWVKKILGGKIDRLMASAEIVTAGNAYLAERARAAGCRRVEFLPTVIDLERYPVTKRQSRAGPLIVGWIGSPATAQYLHELAPAAVKLKERYSVKFIAIGARADQVSGTPFESRPWTESTEVDQLQEFDLGVMPLRDGPWERGKCGYKLIQYMAGSLPVVASPVGVNQDIVSHGSNGFLANTEAEWLEALGRLLADPQLRQEMGEAGRSRVEETYCVQAQAPRLAALLRDLGRS
ncbi:glycosyltransferase family 4 protein [Thermomonas fusca]|uniref:glycosyltransferase family 4 protein n=1 Tax=Thermomonas fusca TaxID=215690 RepID=UPI000A014500|nr:glycosyltransferase family 4 protein [Thermomonas fusca]